LLMRKKNIDAIKFQESTAAKAFCGFLKMNESTEFIGT
jgi:23S rRNA maturation mini-RNase III